MASNKASQVVLARNDPHQVHGDAALTVAEAQHILGLVERGEQARLNWLFTRYRLGDATADAATVVGRLKNLADGVLQFAQRNALKASAA